MFKVTQRERVSGLRRIGLAIAIATLLGWIGANPAWATVYYVNANLSSGADDGSSWENAFHTTQPDAQQDPRTPLQRAIDIADEGDQIWVAKGTYLPHPTNRKESFYLRTDVKIYGGFSGEPCETQLSQRDPRNNVTILSGDLAENDGDPPDFDNYTENSCTIVRVIGQAADPRATLLDGFTIVGGNSESPLGDSLFCTTNKDVIPNCSDNHTDGGGGVRFECNGGGKISNCVVKFNRANYDGGGVYSPPLSFSKVWLVNTVVARNYSKGSGGGIGLTKGIDEANIFNCSIIANEAEGGYGGGIDFKYGGSKMIVNTVIAHNKILPGASVLGAGLSVQSTTTPTKLINSTVAFNDAGSLPGGGVYAASPMDIENCIIWGNMAPPDEGAQLYSTYPFGSDQVNVRHTDMKQDFPDNLRGGVQFGDGCIELNPKFVDPAGDGPDNDPLTWQDNDYSIAAVAPSDLSPALDTGANSYVPNDFGDVDSDDVTSEVIPWDVNRKPRFVNVDDDFVPDCEFGNNDCGDAPVVDLGAYEGPTCGANGDCYDKNWCTLDTCVNAMCSNVCEERPYGDVTGDEVVDLDDMLAIMTAFSGSSYATCMGGVLAGCDLAGSPCLCTQSGTITLDDLIQVYAAFGQTYYCPSCCPGEGDSPLMGGFGADGPLDAAGQVIGLIALLVDDPTLVMGDASDGASTDGFVDADGNPFDPATVLAQAFVLWVERDLSDEDRAFVVELLMANAQNDSSASELFDGMAKELAD